MELASTTSISWASWRAGRPFDVKFTTTSSFCLSYSLLNSSGASVGSPSSPQTCVTTSVDIIGTIPGDGQLIGQVQNNEGSTYQINVTAPLATVPEPATPALIGLGLA